MLSLWLKNIGKQLFRQRALTTAAGAVEAQIPEEKIENDTDGKSKRGALDKEVRSKVISVETSIRYIKSPEFFQSYGNELVWKLYRRNFKGYLPPKTRKTCIRAQKISTGSPCPICRDEYLVVDYRNVELLKQFTSPYNNHVLPSKTTGVCQRQYKKLLVAVQKAKDYGLLTFEVPHRSYNYNIYKKRFLNS